MSIAIGFLCGFSVALVLGMVVSRSSYRLGACDGYRWSKEPDHPGMQKAGRAIKELGELNR